MTHFMAPRTVRKTLSTFGANVHMVNPGGQRVITPYPSRSNGAKPSDRGLPGSWRSERSVPSRFSARSCGTSVRSYGVVW